MIKCFLCSRRRSSHGTKNILKKMLKIAKMGFLLFCGLRCHCSASSSAATALLHFSLARAAVKCSKKCQAKIVYYIFRPCTQRHTVENLCPTLNGMQAKVLPNSLPLPLRGHPRTRAWRSVAAAKGSLAKLWHIFSPFPTFHLRTTNRRWHWTLLRCHHALFRKPKKEAHSVRRRFVQGVCCWSSSSKGEEISIENV